MNNINDITDFYYTAPSDEIFDNLKAGAIRIWQDYDDPYRSSQIARIADIPNVRDNFMFMFAMMDHFNQQKVRNLITDETWKAIRSRMIAGGVPQTAEEFMDVIEKLGGDR